MITREQIPTVLDHPVYGSDGSKLGDAKRVYFDDATGEPDWVTVKMGMFGTAESFVPIHEASVVQDHLEVPYPKDKVKDAPHVDVDSGGHLSEREEHRLYDYYEIDWRSVHAAEDTDRTRSGTDASAAGGTAAMGTAAMGAVGTGAAGDTGTAADTTAGADAGAGAASARSRHGMPTGEASMTRSEERMHVGTERHEVGRARLHKYVVTEEQQQTVPVRHEEVRVERTPISEADRKAARAGQQIGEEEQEIVLMEERAVVETRAEPVERVRLTTDEYIEEETVTGQVRKEQIEADIPEGGERRHRGEGHR